VIVIRIGGDTQGVYGLGNTSHYAMASLALLISATKAAQHALTDCPCDHCARNLRQLQAALNAFKLAGLHG
jgi:hypothetical protein